LVAEGLGEQGEARTRFTVHVVRDG
jgi:hypothetical protein